MVDICRRIETVKPSQLAWKSAGWTRTRVEKGRVLRLIKDGSWTGNMSFCMRLVAIVEQKSAESVFGSTPQQRSTFDNILNRGKSHSPSGGKMMFKGLEECDRS